jgi:hypothetical protein
MGGIGSCVKLITCVVITSGGSFATFLLITADVTLEEEDKDVVVADAEEVGGGHFCPSFDNGKQTPLASSSFATGATDAAADDAIIRFGPVGSGIFTGNIVVSGAAMPESNESSVEDSSSEPLDGTSEFGDEDGDELVDDEEDELVVSASGLLYGDDSFEFALD